MKRRSFKFLFTICCAVIAGVFSCDTIRSIEDPDLHYFVKLYGGDGNQKGVDMIALNDGTFLLLGNVEQPFESDIYLVKINAEGDIIWENTYQEDNIAIARDIERTADGNLIILADYQAVLGADTDLQLIKVSPDGVVIDSVVRGTIADDFSRTVTLLDDGGFIVSGTTELTETFADVTNPDPDFGNFFNYRFDANLNQVPSAVWSPVISGFGGKLDVAVKTFQKTDEYYVFGYSNTDLSFNNPNKRLGLTYFRRDVFGKEDKILFPGNAVNINDTEIQFVEKVAPQLGDGFIVIGTSQNTTGVSEIFMARLRNTLTFESKDQDATLYSTIQLGNRNIRGVAATSSISGAQGFIVLGNEVRGTGAVNFWVTKIDQSGSQLWSSTFGSEAEDDSGAAVAELPDGKILILGTMGLADNQYKMALIKMNPQGQLLK